MKKHAFFLTVLLAILVLLCSCFTTYQARAEITESEANEAMTVVLKKAVKNSNTRFFQKLGSYSFLPEFYKIVEKEKDKIPGMKIILDSWHNYVSNYLKENENLFVSMTSSYVENLNIENGFELISSSNTSGSEFLDKESKDSFISMLTSLVNEMDLTELNTAVAQYNAWAKTENFKNKTNISLLEQKDVSTELVSIFYETYKKTVEMYEELYRTTPDPYTEEIILKVFGIE